LRPSSLAPAFPNQHSQTLARLHAKRHVAKKRAAGRYHLDLACGGSIGNGCGQVGVRFHREACGGSVEGNSSCASESLSEQFDSVPDFARGLWTHETDKRPQTYRQAEDRAIAVDPTLLRCPVEGPVVASSRKTTKISPATDECCATALTMP